MENLTKEIEYITSNEKGDIFKILAQYGKTNLENSSILDLEIVNGIVSSIERSTIYITSDYANYNYVNQNSKFYSNVIVKYDDKLITCDNLDITISDNIAVAYSNVIVKDSNSIMKTQIMTLDLVTKDININSRNDIKINTNYKRQILNNLNLKVKKQEILGMLGPNGVGKSTIFNLITGLKNPNFGEVVIQGINVTNLPINERFTKFKLGLVPQYGGLIHDLSMLDNLKLVAEIHIRQRELREQKINKIVSQFEFEALLNIKAKHLSGGQKKKLVIAMALINDPKILLLDEPFAALDILTIRMLQEIILNLQSTEEISVVICDHQARDASGSPNEVISNQAAKTEYFGDEFNIN